MRFLISFFLLLFNLNFYSEQVVYLLPEKSEKKIVLGNKDSEKKSDEFEIIANFDKYKSANLEVVSILNKTDFAEYEVFNGLSSSLGLIRANSELFFNIPLKLDLGASLKIKCINGSFLTIFIEDSGKQASGAAKENYEGPYYLNMWLQYPDIKKDLIYVPYRYESNKIGKIRIVIGKQGECQLEAVEAVSFL